MRDAFATAAANAEEWTEGTESGGEREARLDGGGDRVVE